MLNSQTVFIEHRHNDKFICHKATLFGHYDHSICHLLTVLTEDIGQTGLPKDMSNRVYHAARKHAENTFLWFWFTLAEMVAYYQSIPARQMEALLLQKKCFPVRIKPQVEKIITCHEQPNRDPEDIRLVFWIESEE